MKNLLTLLSLFCITLLFGQKISDFKYISIPEKFTTFKDDFKLESFLAKALKGKKYIILPENKQEWSAEISGNPCQVANADLLNDQSLFRNRVILRFKDCNNKVISESKGTSKIKEYQEGFTEALGLALTSVPVSNPISNLEIQTESPVEIKKTNPVTVPETKPENTVNKFSNGKLNLQRIQIDMNQFILADSNTSVPYATFKATTKKDVFRVKLSNGDSTLGYFEAGNIVIEIPQSNGEYSKEVFSAN